MKNYLNLQKKSSVYLCYTEHAFLRSRKGHALSTPLLVSRLCSNLISWLAFFLTFIPIHLNDNTMQALAYMIFTTYYNWSEITSDIWKHSVFRRSLRINLMPLLLDGIQFLFIILLKDLLIKQFWISIPTMHFCGKYLKNNFSVYWNWRDCLSLKLE